MGIKTFDQPWAKQLYEMQWNYPYIMDISYVPESMRLDEDAPPEFMQEETIPRSAPVPPQQGANVPTQTSVGPMPPPMQIISPGLQGIKPLIVPALIIVAGIVLYQILK